MGFFKEFKEDLSDAVNELVPGENESTPEEEVMVNTLDNDVDVESELNKLDGLLEQVTKRVDNNEPAAKSNGVQKENIVEDTYKMDTNTMTQTPVAPTPATTSVATGNTSDENAIITAGMRIKGDLESTGSIDVQGTIEGNIVCNGKLVVTGTVNGNSTSSEFFADQAKIAGEVNTSGTAKVGVGSVIIGNITASSAVIAGAVKGDIDVQGPVVVDTSAVIMGNIKSRSVQINNGAVIEGFCSQCYADVDVQGIFN